MLVLQHAAQILDHVLTTPRALVDDVAGHAVLVADQEADELRRSEPREFIAGISGQ